LDLLDSSCKNGCLANRTTPRGGLHCIGETKQIRLNKRIRQEPNQNTERGKPKTTNTETQKHTEKQNNTLYQPKTANRILLQMRAILGNLFGVGDSSKWLWVASIKKA